MSEIKIEPITNYALSKENRPKSEFSKVGIVGCGTVGQNLARMVSSKGIEVVFVELDNEKIQSAIEAISDDIDKMIDRWGMTSSEKRAILSRIQGTTDCTKLRDCEIVFESVRTKSKFANVNLVKSVFEKIEKNINDDTIIATNATILGVTDLASVLKHPERAVAIHFLISVPDAPVVEVTYGVKTSEYVKHKVDIFIKMLDRKLVPVFESPGGISARLVSPLINDACQMFLEGIGSLDDIDDMMTKGLGMRLGPFAIADKIGLDKIMMWLNGMYDEFGDIKFKPHILLRTKARENKLGRKSGEGFYKYDEFGNRTNTVKCC